MQIALTFIFHIGEWPRRTPQPQHMIFIARSASKSWDRRSRAEMCGVWGMSLCWKAGEAQGQPVINTPWFALLTASTLSCRSLTAHRLLDTYASVFKNLSFKDQHFRVFRCASRAADMPLSMAYLCSGSNILSTVCCRKEFAFFLLTAESTMLCCCEALSSSFKLLGFFGSFCNPQGAWAVGRRLSSLCR